MALLINQLIYENSGIAEPSAYQTTDMAHRQYVSFILVQEPLFSTKSWEHQLCRPLGISYPKWLQRWLADTHSLSSLSWADSEVMHSIFQHSLTAGPGLRISFRGQQKHTLENQYAICKWLHIKYWPQFLAHYMHLCSTWKSETGGDLYYKIHCKGFLMHFKAVPASLSK